MGILFKKFDVEFEVVLKNDTIYKGVIHMSGTLFSDPSDIRIEAIKGIERQLGSEVVCFNKYKSYEV